MQPPVCCNPAVAVGWWQCTLPNQRVSKVIASWLCDLTWRWLLLLRLLVLQLLPLVLVLMLLWWLLILLILLLVLLLV